MAWDKKKWVAEYRKKNRDKINAYFRDYYKKNRAKHIKRVNAWKKKNPDKLKLYACNLKSPQSVEYRREISRRHRENNREEWNAYQRDFKDRTKRKKLKAKIIIKNAVKRKRWHTYRVDNDGNITETKIRGRK